MVGKHKPGDLFKERYEVMECIGEGGMGAVYRCRDSFLDRFVALKILGGTGGAFEARFKQEAKIIANLQHPNIVVLYDFGSDGTSFFIVQEYVPGEDLSLVLRKADGPLPFVVAGKILAAVADALAYAHGMNVVHRDIKPGNIRLTPEGGVKVLDFGIATTMRASRLEITQVGESLGTPAYMSPEQLEGKAVDARADIYSFGLVAFEVLSGHKPFAAESLFSMASLRINTDAPPLVNEALPPQIPAIVNQCLQRKPESRPQSMDEIAQVFGKAVQSVTAANNSELAHWPIQTKPAHDTKIAGPVPSEPATGLRRTTRRPPSTEAGKKAEPRRIRTRKVGEDLQGQVIGKFTLHERIAQGRSGPFYKAYDSVRGRLIGLKLIESGDPSTRRRIERAGRIWLDLRHPCLVTVYEVHPDYNGFAGVIASELVDGVPLSDLRETPRLSVQQIVSLGVQLCEALAYMHNKGIIHREVRPHNILISLPDFRVKLLDSGIARHASPEIDAFTRTGMVVGDLLYASPELAEGCVDERADIYAVGAILHELMTAERNHHVATWPSRALIDSISGIPAGLQNLILRAIDPDPIKRFSSANEMAEALKSIIPDQHPRVSPTTVIVTLHGIRTHARWQRAFAEVAEGSGLRPRLDRWNFGFFSSIRFLLPWSRLAKVRWFRTTYETEFSTLDNSLERPSIIAHSFGTYVLGNALLRYPYLRFHKVLLCGSILPRAFPWGPIIERGQVQEVRNEFGTEDIWTKLVDWFVRGTGPSGLFGFRAEHPRLKQERFTFSHSEYFERGHMASQWIPFLKRPIDICPPRALNVQTPASEHHPWGLYALYILLLAVLFAVFRWLI
jgi:serine/threonine protein kinase